MATWDELRNHIQSNWPIMEDNGNHIVLGFRLENGRTQKVIVWDCGQSQNGHWVAVKTPIAQISQIDPRQLLLRNDKLLAGSIGAYDNGLVIYHYSIRIEDVDAAEFETALELVVEVGDNLELELTGSDRF